MTARDAELSLPVRLHAGVRLLWVPTSASADAVLRRVAAACRVPPSQLALFAGSRRLSGPMPLRDGARIATALHVVRRLAGGGVGESSSRAAHIPRPKIVEADPAALRMWKERGGGELEAALESGAMALLDADWVIDLAARGGVLPPRQALPDKAFLSLSEVTAVTTRRTGLPVVLASHSWLQADHPDPHGYNLRALARALRHLTVSGRVAVFYDFSSMHQNCRDQRGKPRGRILGESTAVGRFPAEQMLFEQALESLGTFFSHPHTCVLELTALPPDYGDPARYAGSGNVADYSERGWCFCESSWAAMQKDATLVLDLGKGSGEGDFDASVAGRCTQGRRAPVAPEVFEALLASKGFTNRTADHPLVARLYREGFAARFRAVSVLNYGGLAWGDDEARAVAAMLPHTPALKTLHLGVNAIGDEGARALAEGLAHTPALKFLYLRHNLIGAEGASALAEALPGALALKELYIGNNLIGDEGARALAEALPRAPALRDLYIRYNSIGAEGARALAEALPLALALKELYLGNNLIGDEGARALAEALPRAPGLKELELDSNSIGDEGARALAEALPRAPALKGLMLRMNPIGGGAAAALRTAWGERSRQRLVLA